VKALLLAAGEGTRLRPLTLTIPKCLVDIGGRPLLQHWLDDLAASGFFHTAIVNTHYLADSVEAFLSGYPNHIDVVTSYEARLLGPGGTLLTHRAALSDDDFLVAHADNFSIIDWDRFVTAHRQRPPECVGTMMTFVTDDPRSCGVVETDANGVLQAMHEKVADPPGHLANAAVFLFSPEVFDIIEDFGGSDVVDISRDMIPRLLSRLATFQNTGYHRDIGTPGALDTARRDFEQIARLGKDQIA
jgi:mannose-1-phosphate guanylyltransferase